MVNDFFEHPILNSPYEYSTRHWELDTQGQPTQQIIDSRRKAEFITPIPKPKKRRTAAAQQQMVFDEGKGLSTQQQQYETTSTIINELRRIVDQWRKPHLPHTGYKAEEAIAEIECFDADPLQNGYTSEMQNALDSLPENMRNTTLLVCVDGWTHREVAAKLAIPLGTVLSRVHRAKKKLKAHLTP